MTPESDDPLLEYIITIFVFPAMMCFEWGVLKCSIIRSNRIGLMLAVELVGIDV